MQDTEQWKRLATRLKDAEKDLEILQNWRIKHMSECHPKILDWQGKMWGSWLKLTGVAIGVALAVGFVLGQLYPILDRWLGK